MKTTRVSTIMLLFIFCLTFLCSCKCIQKEPQMGLSENDNSDEKIYEESKYYKIVCKNECFYCYFYNKDSKEVRVEGPLNKLPKVITLDNGLLRFTLQTGTGIGTQWGFFYDATQDIFSDIYQCIYDQNDNKFVFSEANKVIVRDIFDEEKYYKELIINKESFSKVAEPIIDVEFVQAGNAIKIIYLTGDDYKEVTEIFTLE